MGTAIETIFLENGLKRAKLNYSNNIIYGTWGLEVMVTDKTIVLSLDNSIQNVNDFKWITRILDPSIIGSREIIVSNANSYRKLTYII